MEDLTTFKKEIARRIGILERILEYLRTPEDKDYYKGKLAAYKEMYNDIQSRKRDICDEEFDKELAAYLNLFHKGQKTDGSPATYTFDTDDLTDIIYHFFSWHKHQPYVLTKEQIMNVATMVKSRFDDKEYRL